MAEPIGGCASSQSVVTSAMEALEKQITCISELSKSLESRLFSVLRPAQPEAVNDQKDKVSDPGVPISSELCTFSAQIAETCNLLSNILERLGV